MLAKLKEFLISEGVLEEFIEAFTYYTVHYGKWDNHTMLPIGAFNWQESRQRQDNTIRWADLNNKFRQYIGVGGVTHREVIEYFKVSKCTRLLKAIKEFRET